MKNLNNVKTLIQLEFSKFNKLEKQKKSAVILVLILIVIFVIFNIFFTKKPKISKENSEIGKKYSLSQNLVKTEDKWMLDGNKKLDNLTTQIEDLKVEKQELLLKLEELQASISSINDSISMKQNNNTVNAVDPFAGVQYVGQNGEMIQTNKMIATYNINLPSKVKPNSNFYKKTKDYIPQGAYASGILISAVDAGVGTEAQANPRPVLIRLNGDAISSSLKGEKEKTDVRGCVITAGAEGDLSSERVYIKLSRMTCTRKKGEAFEVAIKGYVSGLGKAGIRGVVVSRDWDKLSKAFASGLISGFGGAYSQSLQPPAAIMTNGTVLTQQQSLGNAAKSGAGAGIKKAGDTLSDYYIKRAEQYQPVISIPAGTDIEVVFLEGVSLLPSANDKVETPTNNNNQLVF
jgi:conjugal transfer pilus assembly protein TraB